MTIADLSDYSTFAPGAPMGLTTQRITGARCCLEWVARRWLTPTGALFWAPSAGRDVRQLENADGVDLSELQAGLAHEARQVSHVLDAAVAVTVSGEQVTIRGDITLDDLNTYPLAVSIGQAGEAIALFGQR